jgi:hypothetical protein
MPLRFRFCGQRVANDFLKRFLRRERERDVVSGLVWCTGHYVPGVLVSYV